MFSAVVIDDEPAARRGLAAMVRADGDFATVHECGDRAAAVALIRSAQPDVVLLDIQLNPGTGFDVIEMVGTEAMPHTIFVTAFDAFALKAFDAAAIDYVLKPVDPRRLRVALERAKARAGQAATAEDAARLASLATRGLRPAIPRPIAVADGERTLLFEANEIVRVEAADYYARIHARGRAWLIRESLDALAERLPCPPFFRVHRSAIVNLQFATEIARVSRHRYHMLLRDGSRVPVSSERRVTLDAWLAARE